MTAPRIQPAGGLFHAGTRSLERRLFLDSYDYEAYLRYVDRASERFGWVVLGYCLMPNHVHLIVETPEATLADGMRHINQSYAQRFNRRRDRRGYVQESRYWSCVVEESHFLAAVVYVALNPLRAELVDVPSAWRWSSYAVLAGRAPRPACLALERSLELAGGNAAAVRSLVDGIADMSRALGAGHVPVIAAGTPLGRP
jgi:REP element-mobilizing transposase RayT